MEHEFVEQSLRRRSTFMLRCAICVIGAVAGLIGGFYYHVHYLSVPVVRDPATSRRAIDVVDVADVTEFESTRVRIPEYDVHGVMTSEMYAESAVYYRGKPIEFVDIKVIEFKNRKVTRVTVADKGHLIPAKDKNGSFVVDRLRLSGNVHVRSFGEEDENDNNCGGGISR